MVRGTFPLCVGLQLPPPLCVPMRAHSDGVCVGTFEISWNMLQSGCPMLVYNVFSCTFLLDYCNTAHTASLMLPSVFLTGVFGERTEGF